MKLKLLTLLTLFLFNCKETDQKVAVNTSEDNETVVYLIRHAEKELTTKSNPELIEKGLKRANDWATYFKDKNIAAIYSTNFKRTMATALPTSQMINSEIITYKPKSLTKKKLLMKHKGKSIVIVGHSNTIPFLANNLIREKIYKDINENIYNHLYKITLKNSGTTHELITIN